MTNALNSLKLELEQSDNKGIPVNIIRPQADFILNDETQQKSIQADDQPDDCQMLLREKATEESTSTLTIISDGEQKNANEEIEEIEESMSVEEEKADKEVRNSMGTELIAVEVSTITVSENFKSASGEDSNDVSANTLNQDENSDNPKIEKVLSELENSLQCQKAIGTTCISNSEEEKHADPEIYLDELTEQLAHLKLDEKSNSPVPSNRSPSPRCEEINVPHMKEPTHSMMEHQPEVVGEKLMACKSTSTVELIANQNDSLVQKMELLKEENQKFRELNENVREEIKVLEGQTNDEKERYENSRRKLKKKVFEYEKKIEELLQLRDEEQKTNDEALKDLLQKNDKLISEKRDGEHKFKELEKLFEAQKLTISDIEMCNNHLMQQNENLENGKQLIETDHEKLKKTFADEKELNKNAKRKLKNKIAEFERKIESLIEERHIFRVKMLSLAMKNSRLEGAHAMVFVKPLKEVLAGRKIGENENISKAMLEESVMSMNEELNLIRKLHDDQQDSLINAVSFSEASLNEQISLNVDYSKIIEDFMIETPSFLGKKYMQKEKTLVGDGDKVVANHFNNVDKLMQIVHKMNETLAGKIEIIEDHCHKQDAQSNQIKQLEIELKNLQQVQTTENHENENHECDKNNRNFTENEGENEGFENEKNERNNDSTIDGETTDQAAEKSIETGLRAVEAHQYTSSIDFVSENDESNIDLSTKISNEDEISKIQKLEKEMSELRNSLQESKSQDRILKASFVIISTKQTI